MEVTRYIHFIQDKSTFIKKFCECGNRYIINQSKNEEKSILDSEFILWDDDLLTLSRKRQTYQSVRAVSSFCGGGGSGNDGDSGLLSFVDDIVLVSCSFLVQCMVLSIDLYHLSSSIIIWLATIAIIYLYPSFNLQFILIQGS